MTEEYGERQISTARMVDRHEAGVRNDVERLLAAIIRMRAPADIGEKTGGMAEPALFAGFVEAGRHHEAVGPLHQLLAMLRRARAQLIEMARPLDQRILL